MWVFRLKGALHKARCFVRGDLQFPLRDYNPDDVYAPVASHEAIRIMFSLAASEGLVVEGGDFCNAYLYGDINIPIIMQQHTDSTGIEERPGFVCKLQKSMYGLKQAGQIWGSVLASTLQSWGCQQSIIDPRVFFKQYGKEYNIIIVVVDDMSFVSNSTRLLDHVKKRLHATFDVKLFGSFTSFIGWEIQQCHGSIAISQTAYIERILTKYGFLNDNGVYAPLPANANL